MTVTREASPPMEGRGIEPFPCPAPFHRSRLKQASVTLGNLQVNSWRSAINRKAVGSNLVCRAKHLSTSRSAVSWYEVPKHANSSGMPNTARNKTWIEGRSHAPTRLERPHRRIE